jgi:hypothetical protein
MSLPSGRRRRAGYQKPVVDLMKRRWKSDEVAQVRESTRRQQNFV